MPTISPEQIDLLSGLVAQYITTQQNRYAPRAVPPSAQQKASMAGFFTPQVIDGTRLLELGDGERVVNPEFYPMLREVGIDNPPDMSAMLAITFSDTVVAHEPFTDGLLFHELVHVEQYRQLGVLRFSDLYVRGFLSGGSYEEIPLEKNAYMLGGLYEENRALHFSTADEVARWIAEARF
jgi:hypothetical protein